jgi:L-lactate dehydrogenase
MKVSIIGLGNVGKSVLGFLSSLEEIKEIALVCRNTLSARYEAMDMNHAASLIRSSQMTITYGGYELLTGSDIVVVTAGVPMKENIDTKVKLALANKDVIDEQAAQIVKYCPDSIVIVVTNPVEAMTYAFAMSSNFNPHKVIGTGTLNDTSRLKYYISNKLNVSLQEIEAFVLGEHVVGNFIVWSRCYIKGILIDEYFEDKGIKDFNRDEALEYINQSPFEILNGKGNTTFSIGGAVTRIIKAIINDENAILPVAVLANGEYNTNDIAVSLPCKINKNGISEIEEFYLSNNELIKLDESVKSISKLNSIFFR